MDSDEQNTSDSNRNQEGDSRQDTSPNPGATLNVQPENLFLNDIQNLPTSRQITSETVNRRHQRHTIRRDTEGVIPNYDHTTTLRQEQSQYRNRNSHQIGTARESEENNANDHHITNHDGNNEGPLRGLNRAQDEDNQQLQDRERLPNRDQNPRPNSLAGLVRFEITVSSTTPPSQSELAILYSQYPRDFEHFSDDELITSLTNFASRYISSFHEEKAANVPAVTDLKAVLYSFAPPPITLRAYIRRLVVYSKVARIHFLMMTVYIDRLAATSMALIPSESNVHRILAGALAIGAEQYGDVLDKPHACRVAGIGSTDELDKIISVFKDQIGSNSRIFGEDLITSFNRLNAMKNTEEFLEPENMSALSTAAPPTGAGENSERETDRA